MGLSYTGQHALGQLKAGVPGVPYELQSLNPGCLNPWVSSKSSWSCAISQANMLTLACSVMGREAICPHDHSGSSIQSCLAPNLV